MYPRTEFEMSEKDKNELLEACKPVPYMVVGGMAPRSQQENANEAWARLGKKMGFDPMSVKPISGKGMRFFSAVRNENETEKAEREAVDQQQKRQAKIEKLVGSIESAEKELKKLREEAN